MLGKPVLLSFVTLTTVVTIIAARQLAGQENTQRNEPTLRTQFQRLNGYARTARTNNNHQATRAFTDSVVNTFAPPSNASALLKDRLSSFEAQERTESSLGITEASLAHAINAFTTRIGAPEFAKTSSLQIRVLRAALHFRLPDAIAPTLPVSNLTRSSALNQIPKEIGPAEAMILASTLLRSKLADGDLQVTPEEWNETFLARQQQQVTEASVPSSLNAAAPPVQQSTYTLQALSVTDKSKALQGSLHTFFSSLGSADAVHQQIDKFVEDMHNVQ